MQPQPHSDAREIIVADAIRDVVCELRMVDLADYVAFIHLERFASVADLVDSASELFFQPGTLRLGHGGQVKVDWNGQPEVLLDLELKPTGATIYFTLGLTDTMASVNVTYVSFDVPSPDPDANTRYMRTAIEGARIRKSPAMPFVPEVNGPHAAGSAA